jgi:hypothetical protein
VIVVSVLLIVVAVALLALGLVQASGALLIGSIAASLLAAVSLVLGSRRSAAARARRAGSAAEGYEPPDHSAATGRPGARARDTALLDMEANGRRPAGDDTLGAAAERVAAGDTITRTIPVQGNQGHGAAAGAAQNGAAATHGAAPGGAGHGGTAGTATVPGGAVEYLDEDADPPDEPAPQQVTVGDAARVARMTTEVLVVDGRPRYHLPGCVHLLGRESEPLPVGEAVELGFTPCSLCEPDSALLADARRV